MNALIILSFLLSLVALILAIFCFIRQQRTEAFLRSLPGTLKKAAIVAIAATVAIHLATRGKSNVE